MANVQVKEEVKIVEKTFTLELSESELKYIVSGITASHYDVVRLAKGQFREEELIEPREGFILWQQLRDASKGR